MTALLVCLCGGLGAVARFVLNTSIQRWWSRAFPLSTFVINVIATFCAGVAAAAYASMAVEQSTYLLFVTGFLGGFSTFSTAINEMVSLARSCAWRWAGWSVRRGAEPDAGIWRAVFPRLNFTHRWMNRIVRRSIQR